MPSMTSLPPGPLFLYHLSLRNLPTLILYYGVIRLFIFYLDIATPTWLAIIIALSARLAFYVTLGRWRVYRANRDAAARGAVMVPRVREYGFSNLRTMVDTISSGYPMDAIHKWCEEYGSIFEIGVIADHLMYTVEPQHVKAILATQFDTFEKGHVLHTQFHDFLGIGVFNADGDMWKFHRGMTRPFFNRERISDFDIFDRHANDAIAQVMGRLTTGHPVDFQDVVSRFTLDSATEFLFSNDIRTLSAGLPYPASISPNTFANHPSNLFASAFVAGQISSMRRTVFGSSWPLDEFWKNEVIPHRKVVDEFIEPVLVEALTKGAREVRVEGKLSTDREKADIKEETLLSHLLDQTQDVQILKDELVNLLVAGRDTTASTLTFGVYVLTQYPHITRRLREEILDKVGYSRPTFEQMKDMKYLRAFINETLRLYPPVPVDSRSSNKATVFPSIRPGQKPFYIPANKTCMYSVFLMHRRTDLWGPDAHEFDPDRFIDERLSKYLVPNPFIFLPFNAGPRICLGQQFAYNEVSFFLIRLLQRFSEFTLASDAQPADSLPPAEWSNYKGTKGRDKVWPGIHFTMYVKGGLWMRMEEARRDE